MDTDTSTQKRSGLSIHQGSAIVHLAGFYPTLSEVICEATQNALDSHARLIMIVLDYKTRTATISDDGDGVTVSKFEQALNSVCHTVKTDKDSLGQFGIGLISPLNKCDEFTFTSVYKNSSTDYKQWKFVTSDLRKQQIIEGIPMEEVTSYIFGQGNKPPLGKTFVPWRTQVRLTRFTTDRAISKVDIKGLRETILERFGEKMRLLRTVVSIKIHRPGQGRQQETFDAPEFEGSPLEPVTYEGPNAGKTFVKMYLARKKAGKRNGKVLVGIADNLYRINFQEFAKSAEFSDDTLEVLNSGILEGTFLSRRCTLAVDRKHFIKNDALTEFCEHIEKWALSVGIEHVDLTREKLIDERRQLVGVRSLQQIQRMLETDEFKTLQEVLRGIQKGTIGPGHVNFQKGKKINDFKQLTTIYDDNNSNEESSEGESKSNNGEGQKNREHHSVVGPHGSKRKEVRHEGIGLQFFYEEMSGKSVLWEYEAQTGILRFNVRHPIWERAERNKGDRVLMRLQENIAITALIIETMPKESRPGFQQFAQKQLEFLVPLIEIEHPFVRTSKR